jgi:cell division septal protein FtsQ
MAGGAALAVALVVAGRLFGARLLRQIAFFDVHNVEVIGTHYLDQDTVVARLGLRPHASVFDPLAPVRAAADSIPGIISADVERRLPGTLRVTIHEATPVALTATPKRLVLIDQRGHILPFDPTRAPRSLPIIDRDSSVAALVARLMTADPEGYAMIETAQAGHDDVVLSAGTQQILLRPDAGAGLLRDVAAVRGYLESHQIAWRAIDARYRTRIFVRKDQG